MAEKKDIFYVTGMSCAGCASNVEQALRETKGVKEAKVNFADATAQVSYGDEATPEILQKAVQDAGYDLVIGEKATDEAETVQAEEYRRLKRMTVLAIALSLPVFVIGMFFMHMPGANWIMLAFTFPVMLVPGRIFFVNAWKQLRHRRANMDTLVAVSTGVAFLFSLFNTLWPEFWEKQGLPVHVYYEASAVIIALILLGRLLESRAKANTSAAIRKLMGLQPDTVIRISADGTEQEIPLGAVEAGNILLVKPGDRIPVDGTVSEGESFVDESMITGEPIPAGKKAGAGVFAGTINQRGSFRFRADKVGADTVLAHIIRMVREAQGSKAPVQQLVDRIAAVFVPVVIGIALVTFAGWLIFGGTDAFTHALLTSVTVLVIACPCALGLATPTAIMVGIGKGAENNILIKDAESLERLCRVTAVVLDKTGTITEGHPAVTDVVWTSGKESARYAPILFFLESRSEHPLAEAVTIWLKESNTAAAETGTFESVTGQGVKGVVDGETYFIGNLRLLGTNEIKPDPRQMGTAEKYGQEGKTVIYFADSRELIAMIAIEDPVKCGSAEAIGRLQETGIEVYMLTGDNRLTAQGVAARTGLKNFRAEMMPSDKSDFIRELQKSGAVVAMVGDGINDSQALAQADVSVAMGKGSDIAIDVAKITLITSDLNVLPKALALSRQTVAAIRQNLFWAFIYNLIGIPLAAGILYPCCGFLLNPMIAAAAMAFSSVSVVTNSLRIRAKKIE